MQPLERLWSCLESIPGLCLLRSDWEGRLAYEFPLAEPFLRPTDQPSRSYPCPNPGGACRRRVVDHGNGDIVAVCGDSPRRCENVEVTESDLVLYQFDVQVLCRELARLLEIEPRFEAVTEAGATWVVGVRSPARGEDFLVYLTIPLTPEDLRQAASRLVAKDSDRFLLLAPSEEHRDLTTRDLLRRHEARFGTLKAVVAVDDERSLVAMRPVSEVFAGLEPGPSDEAPNLFQRSGDTWTIRYQGQAVHLAHVIGLSYIAAMLREPEREFHVMELPTAAGAAMAPAVSSRGNLAVELPSDDLDPIDSAADERARAEYKARIEVIEEELAEAEAFHDFDRAGRFRQERESIEAHIVSAFGLAGRRRATQDPVKRARDRVRKALKLALDRIDSEHPALGRHLHAAVRLGTYCSYCPGATVSWTD